MNPDSEDFINDDNSKHETSQFLSSNQQSNQLETNNPSKLKKYLSQEFLKKFTRNDDSEEEEKQVQIKKSKSQSKFKSTNSDESPINQTTQLQDQNMQASYLHLFESMKALRDQLKIREQQLQGELDGTSKNLLEKQIQMIDHKMQELKDTINSDDFSQEQHHQRKIFQLVDDIQQIILRPQFYTHDQITHYSSHDSDDFTKKMYLEFEPTIKKQQRLPNKQKKQERKKARLQKSKQAISVFTKWLIHIVIAIHSFLKNPDNIFKCVVLAVLCFFGSSYMNIPDMSDRPKLYFLDWLAYNRSSRAVLFSGALCLISFEWYLIYIIWVFFVGFRTDSENKKIKLLLNECNPVFQLSLLFMTDKDLINNKFDFVVWFCNIFFYSTLKVYYLSSTEIIKKTLNNITPEDIRKISIMSQLNIFSIIIQSMNCIYTVFGVLFFHKVGIHALILLYYGGIINIVQYAKIFLITKSLKTQYQYYINQNIDIINEPFFFQELFADAISNILKLIYNFILVSNYFKTVSLHFVLHIWLFYILSEIHSGITSLKKLSDLYMRQRKIQLHLDELFPKTDPSRMQPDEICTICHDVNNLLKKQKNKELIISRTLPCGHKFHLKCLFNWLKSQQICPICRQVVQNIDSNVQNASEIPFILRLIQTISNISVFSISVLFTTRQQPAEVPQNENEQQQQQQEQIPEDLISNSSNDSDEQINQQQKIKKKFFFNCRSENQFQQNDQLQFSPTHARNFQEDEIDLFQ